MSSRIDFEIPTSDLTLIQDLEQDFSCPICHQIFCNTVVTPCGIKVCRYCFIVNVKEMRKCPICRKRCGKNYLAYPKIDTRIASVFLKVGPKFYDDRQAFLKRRKILELKFDLEKEAIAERLLEEEERRIALLPLEEQIALRMKMGLQLGDSAWNDVREKKSELITKAEKDGAKKRRPRRLFRAGNVQPNPFKKPLAKNSTGSLRGDFLVRKALMAQNGSKTLLSSESTSSSLAVRHLYSNIKSDFLTHTATSLMCMHI